MKTEIYATIKLMSPIKRKVLLMTLQQLYPDLTDRIMRLKVAELIQDGKCIASGNNGYSIIENMTDLENAMTYLKSKAFPLFKRAKDLHKNFTKDKGLQLSFTDFFEMMDVEY